MKKTIITISRQFGSGGREVGEKPDRKSTGREIFYSIL